MVNIIRGLRKGNWVKSKLAGLDVLVDDVIIGDKPCIKAVFKSGKSAGLLYVDEIEGLKVTEDILRKNGFSSIYAGAWKNFEKTILCREIFIKDFYEIMYAYDYMDRGSGFFQTERMDGFLNVDYVHQLQNLYFAKTGKELEIEL